MSKYNQLAISTNPTLLLSAPIITDQSGNSTSLSSNNLEAPAQPIIYGNASSFLVTETTGVVIDEDIVFIEGSSTELVLLAESPTEDINVLSTDVDSGLFLTPDSVMLRVVSTLEDLILTQVIQVKVKDWSSKKHILIGVGSGQVTLSVNAQVSSASFVGALVQGDSVTIGASVDSRFLFDGLGIYTNKLANKTTSIDDPGSGHSIYASILHGGKTTKFDTFLVDEINTINLDDFHIEAADLETRSLVYSFLVSQTDQVEKYLVLKVNNDSTVIEYDISGGGIEEFISRTAIELTDSDVVISLRVDIDAPIDLEIEITTMLDADILFQTPADFVADGTPIFPATVDESIVNCPEGVWLGLASYTGTWKAFEQDLAEPPKTIEFLFKLNDPTETVVLFDSADGSVATDAQSGYTLWLNGVEVADLDDLKWNQWNHLVLVNDTAAATEFTLNTDGSSDPMNVNYQFLTAYPTSLVEADIEQLYSILAGVDIISVVEDPVTFAEGEFDNGQGFEVFSLTWAIVGSGGN